MTTRFCYHCRLHHPESEMRQIDIKGGKRWRCIKSIEATRQSREAREAFGRTVTEINKAASASAQRIQQAAKEARSGL